MSSSFRQTKCENIGLVALWYSSHSDAISLVWVWENGMDDRFRCSLFFIFCIFLTNFFLSIFLFCCFCCCVAAQEKWKTYLLSGDTSMLAFAVSSTLATHAFKIIKREIWIIAQSICSIRRRHLKGNRNEMQIAGPYCFLHVQRCGCEKMVTRQSSSCNMERHDLMACRSLRLGLMTKLCRLLAVDLARVPHIHFIDYLFIIKVKSCGVISIGDDMSSDLYH